MIQHIHERDRWMDFFFGLCKANAAMSKDPSTKVGSVIVRPDRTVASMGWNGFPAGCNDDPLLYLDRTKKYPRTVHAEMNAILSARQPLAGYILFSWPMCPCDRCMPHLIQAGINRVCTVPIPEDQATRWGEAQAIALEMAKEVGITVVIYHPVIP